MVDFKRERKLSVVKTSYVTPHIKRITFFCKDFLDFSNNEKGGYLKLLFSKGELNDKNLVRPYTIRNFRKQKLEIDIDFIIHNSSHGVASKWASKADKGDEIFVTGPGTKPIIKNADWIFFIGDMSSLPAISANLEEIEQNTKGIIVIEIISKKDKIKIKKPKNFTLHWIVNKEEDQNQELYKKILTIEWLAGKPFIWAACEFSAMKKLRNYFQNIKKIEKEYIYISSYWKKGSDQEQHKIIKKKDNQIWNA